MKRISTSVDLKCHSQYELFRQTVFHEAGHAVAIYLRNKQNQLPPVFFQITLDVYDTKPIDKKYLARVEGGHLVEILPYTLAHFPKQQQSAYLMAIEADIVNLLAGPLAEAKYVLLRNDEVLSRELISVEALASYGGASDLDMACEYIHCLMSNMQQHFDKVEDLFCEAFNFINVRKHWKIITDLAHYIIACKKNIIPCEEIISVIEGSITVA